MMSVDVYVAGFPCQPFSTAGKQQGFEDSKGRGTIFHHILEYIAFSEMWLCTPYLAVPTEPTMNTWDMKSIMLDRICLNL